MVMVVVLDLVVGGPKKELSNEPRTIQGRLTMRLRAHLRKWRRFIDFFTPYALADKINVCRFVPSQEQAALPGTPARPDKIGTVSTNTVGMSRAFIVKALPHRKYVRDDIFPDVILEFENGFDEEINTNSSEMRARQSSSSKVSSSKRRRTAGPGVCGGGQTDDGGDGFSSGVDDNTSGRGSDGDSENNNDNNEEGGDGRDSPRTQE
jgi:hypothetical protein